MTKQRDTHTMGGCMSSSLQTSSQDIHDENAVAEAAREDQVKADEYTESHAHTDVNLDAHREEDDAVSTRMPQCDGLGTEEEIYESVQKALLQMGDVCRYLDVETIISLVVPKVLLDLNPYDRLHDEMQALKHSLSSCKRQSKIIADDIVEIYLDLHNIYSKLDRLDKSLAKPANSLLESENSVNQ